jgi:inorganic pyrophosphatase
MLSSTKFCGFSQTIYYNQKKLADQAMQEFCHYKEKPPNFATEENWRDEEETRSLEMVPRIL